MKKVYAFPEDQEQNSTYFCCLYSIVYEKILASEIRQKEQHCGVGDVFILQQKTSRLRSGIKTALGVLKS